MSAVRRTASGKAAKPTSAARTKASPKPRSKKGEPKRIPAVSSVLDVLRGPTVNDPEIVFAWRRMIAMMILVATLLGAHVWVRQVGQDLSYEKQYVERIIQRLEFEYSELETSVNHEASATVLEERAIELGLRMPELGQVQQFQFVAAPTSRRASAEHSTGAARVAPDSQRDGTEVVGAEARQRPMEGAVSSESGAGESSLGAADAGEVVADAQP